MTPANLARAIDLLTPGYWSAEAIAEALDAAEQRGRDAALLVSDADRVLAAYAAVVSGRLRIASPWTHGGHSLGGGPAWTRQLHHNRGQAMVCAYGSGCLVSLGGFLREFAGTVEDARAEVDADLRADGWVLV